MQIVSNISDALQALENKAVGIKLENFTSDELIKFFGVLKTNNSLQQLNLQYNQIGDFQLFLLENNIGMGQIHENIHIWIIFGILFQNSRWIKSWHTIEFDPIIFFKISKAFVYCINGNQ